MPWITLKPSSLRSLRRVILAGCVATIMLAAPAWAQDPFAEPKSEPQQPGKPSDDARFEALAKQLNRVRFRGNFTMVRDGKTQSQQTEEYIIQSAKKLPQGDKWQLLATIRYGKVNATLPLVLDIKWADQTPVITLDKLAIPGLGTFSARVLIHDNRYAGTWQHDQVGGHLFGTIEKLPEEPPNQLPSER